MNLQPGGTIEIIETDSWIASHLISGHRTFDQILEESAWRVVNRDVRAADVPGTGRVWLLRDTGAVHGWRIYKANYDSSG